MSAANAASVALAAVFDDEAFCSSSPPQPATTAATAMEARAASNASQGLVLMRVRCPFEVCEFVLCASGRAQPRWRALG